LSFLDELWISPAAKRDWPYFARWHYRSHHVGLTRFVTLLWHGAEPIGICLFVSPPMSLAPRNRFFGRSGRWERTSIRTMNRQLAMLSRVVLHPTYRGAGVASAFIRRSCELSGFRWVEALAQMGHVNPFFERAGFVRVGTSHVEHRSRLTHSRVYGGGRHGGTGLVTQETHRKSRYSAPVYYVFDNRQRCCGGTGRIAAGGG
jgi:GNAT superfamily N-acetyltransferase